MLAIDWNPADRKLRDFGLIGGAMCLGVACWLWSRQDVTPAVWVLATLGLSLGVLAALWPDTLRYLYLGLTLVTFPIGWVVSHVVLGVIWLGVFTPIALWFRLTGRDALQRKLDRTAETYWQPRPPTPEPQRYLRQF